MQAPHAQNQRSPAEGKGKGQEQGLNSTPERAEARFKQHALKGQKLLAQGNTLGINGRKPVAL